MERLGRYQLIRRIAIGGMAELFIAHETGLAGFQRFAVVKRILPALAEDEGFVTLFLDEARLAARLTHPKIVQTYELGQDGLSYYIAMEYVAGCDLESLLAASKQPLPLADAIRVTIEVLEGLHYAHSLRDSAGVHLGVVHRDIAPKNILVSKGGALKIVDFGIAKARTKVSITAPGLVLGTYSYMSPEQAAGADVDCRADVFATGALLYRMVTGIDAYRGEGMDLIAKVRTGDFHPPRLVRPDLPSEVERVILEAMSFKLDDRYSSAAEMRRDLARVQRGLGLGGDAESLSEVISERLPALERDLEALTSPEREGEERRGISAVVPAVAIDPSSLNVPQDSPDTEPSGEPSRPDVVSEPPKPDVLSEPPRREAASESPKPPAATESPRPAPGAAPSHGAARGGASRPDASSEPAKPHVASTPPRPEQGAGPSSSEASSEPSKRDLAREPGDQHEDGEVEDDVRDVPTRALRRRPPPAAAGVEPGEREAEEHPVAGASTAILSGSDRSASGEEGATETYEAMSSQLLAPAGRRSSGEDGETVISEGPSAELLASAERGGAGEEGETEISEGLSADLLASAERGGIGEEGETEISEGLSAELLASAERGGAGEDGETEISESLADQTEENQAEPPDELDFDDTSTVVESTPFGATHEAPDDVESATTAEQLVVDERGIEVTDIPMAIARELEIQRRRVELEAPELELDDATDTTVSSPPIPRHDPDED